MKNGVLFKQRYAPRGKAGTPGLNVRHLQYIATRPGAVYNAGCGFSLWGRLSGDDTIRVQTDLDRAKREVREASQTHTVYRAVLSVNDETAQRSGLYDRANWERLIGHQIAQIAGQMDICHEDLRWCASFHCEQGHPHVHLMYWDSSDTPRPEFVPHWEEKAERIRAALSGEINREEIHREQAVCGEQAKRLRTMLGAMCAEANPMQILNARRVHVSGEGAALAKQLDEVLRTLPPRGSLRYAYLPPVCKHAVDALVERCLHDSALCAQYDAYLRHTREVSELYGNGAKAAEEAVRKADSALRTQLGNEVMRAVRELNTEFARIAPRTPQALRTLLDTVCASALPQSAAYGALLATLPRERIPEACMMQLPGFRDALDATVGELLSDARVRTQLQGYAAAQADSGTDEAQREAYSAAMREAVDALRTAITNQARQDALWTQEALSTACVTMLAQMLRSVSQRAAQTRCQAAERRIAMHTRDRSKEAQHDNRAAREFGSDCTG